MNAEPRKPTGRNYLALWPSMLAVSMGLMAILPTLGLYIDEQFGLEGEELSFWTGWVYSAAPLSAACAGPFWGVLGDRGGRRRMVLRAAIGISVATALMPSATTLPWLVALRVLQGLFAGFVAPAMALGTDGVAPERQGLVIGRLQLGLALGLFLGPALGAEIAFHFGRAAVFYFTSAVALLAAVPVVWFVPSDRPARADTPRPKLATAFRTDVAALLRNRIFAVLLGCVFLMRFGQHMVEPFIALWIRELGALPLIAATVDSNELALERTIAAAFIMLAVAQILLTTRWGKLADRIGPLRCLTILGGGMATMFFATAFVQDVTWFLTLRAGAAVFMAGGMTLAYSAAAKRVAPERKSLAFTLVQSGMQFGLSLGPIVGGLLAGDGGVPRLYWIGGCCLLAAATAMAMLRRATG